MPNQLNLENFTMAYACMLNWFDTSCHLAQSLEAQKGDWHLYLISWTLPREDEHSSESFL